MSERTLPSMEGRHVLITGATSGIGFEIAVGIALLGGRLTLACRDLTRGRSAEDAVRRATGASSHIDVRPLDTSSTRAIREFAQAFRESHDRLDVLVNNAGISQGERKLSVDNVELTFGTNVLGYFTLTNDARCVTRRSKSVSGQNASG
jgi:NAD(P)-dependent dehydrogenase (short-subunit alcohol dehydrogenase family)